jgi:hypothetical protein
VRQNSKVFTWSAREKEFDEIETKWDVGQPSASGNCIYAKLRNTSEETALAVGDCTSPRKFICEVIFNIIW